MTASYLQQELSQRLRKLLFIEQQSPTVAHQLVRELRLFGWLRAEENSARRPANASHTLTPEGTEALRESQHDKRGFRRRLAVRMHQVYIVPGWFVARLWQINPDGQGEIILPAPWPGWQPQSRPWKECSWNKELETHTLQAVQKVRHVSPTGFPIEENRWTAEVRKAWERRSLLRPRGVEAKKATPSYRPRRRLAQAMREASVRLLFNRVSYGGPESDFPPNAPRLDPRTFMAWCPRLESLEFIFYSDWHPRVHGRILFPAAVFRSQASSDRFEAMPQIVDPDGRRLWLHQPKWPIMQDQFWKTLVAAHRRISPHVNSMYVSLLDVRDEVCRQLRLSAARFDEFLGNALDDMQRSDFSISIETDIREEQRSGYGLLRRPVYIRGVPHTLIAVAHLLEAERSLR